ncbi:hypothetical protein ABIF68_009360 [Bradyrhizobium japonicum]|uniref:hypothetical protein n=1 Tax=Bradyrhizobium TaxID=374 RepID=UPI0005764971|nr:MULTISPECIES: hypothetical protein [Bradyrhizobium]MDI2074748.1 hypothetical protein [Bradyrhizobium sp. Mp27]
MRHEAVERLYACVLQGIELAAKTERHLDAGIRRRLAPPVADLHVRARHALALLKVLDDALARLGFVKGQHRRAPPH